MIKKVIPEALFYSSRITLSFPLEYAWYHYPTEYRQIISSLRSITEETCSSLIFTKDSSIIRSAPMPLEENQSRIIILPLGYLTMEMVLRDHMKITFFLQTCLKIFLSNILILVSSNHNILSERSRILETWMGKLHRSLHVTGIYQMWVRLNVCPSFVCLLSTETFEVSLGL